MARNVKQIVIKDGRDAGKVFVVTEMAARPAHTWATRAIFAMMNSGADIPDNVAAMGIAGMVMIGISGLTKVPYDLAAPLLEELLDCARFVPDASRPEVSVSADDKVIEDFTTYFTLQNAAWDVLSEPFMSAARSTSASAVTAQA